MSKYNYNTPYSKLVNNAKRKVEICPEAMTWSKKFLGKTMAEMIELVGWHDETYDPSWGVFLLTSFGAEIDTVIRRRLIIPIKDPMMAFSLYLSLPWLTDEEDRLLEEKFKGKLPNAEKELADRVVTRAKGA